MLTYCGKDFDIFLDLTGPDNWQLNNIFLHKIMLLSQNKDVFYVSNLHIEGTVPECYYNFRGSVDNMTQLIIDDMDTDESGVLIISNNAEHIKRWVELGYSTIYLMTENCELYKELSYMPDEIWNHINFNSFVDNIDFRLTYTSEKIGFPQISLSQTTLGTTYTDFIKVPNTNLSVDVVFTGRYFTLKDNRNYNSPLSRAIIGFKNNLQSFNLAVKRTFGQLINNCLISDPSISHITFVPPRPNKTSRFTGLENYVEDNKMLDYTLLFSKNDYPSPKNYSTFDEKYRCIYGQIGCSKKISGHVLLVDDVFTSGATIAECARILYEAGASKVTVLPLAFTQKINFQEQYTMPVIFDTYGNEYFLKFRNSDSKAFWSSKNDNGSYNNMNFELINKEYLKYHGKWSTKLGWPKKYDDEKEIKAVIFDLDNTLLQTNHLEGYRQNSVSIESLNIINEKHIIINPNLLSELKQAGMKIGIVTSSPRNYALKLLTLCKYPFDYLVAGKDTLRGKPSPDPLLKCALKLKVNPEHVLNIGDQGTDMEAGNSAGMMNLDINTVVASNIIENIIQNQQNLAK